MFNFSLIATAVVAVSAIPAGAVFIRKLAYVQRVLDDTNALAEQLTRPRDCS